MLPHLCRAATLAATCLLAGSLATAAQAIDGPSVEIDHDGLSKTFLQRAGFESVPAEEVTIEDLLEKGFFTIRLGVFDLAISAHDAKRATNGDDFMKLAVALLDIQAQFLDWLGPKAPGIKQAEKDIKTLRSYCSKLRGDVINNLEDDQHGELTENLKVSKKILEAQERFGAYMAKGTPLGLDREDEFVDPFIVAPDRRAFLELLSTFGAISPDNKSIYWTNDVASWTNTYFNDVSVVALQFANLGPTTSGAFGGISMNSRTPTGMQQQIAQLAGNAMFDNLYGAKIPPSLAGAFAVNLVIDVYGECNTRVDGDLRARRTEAREMFVPGGASEGGVLPPDLADSRWRGEHGKDHFLVALQQSQAAGESAAKKRGERTTCFELMNDSERGRMVIKAPFLGTPAADKEAVPDEYWGDSLEFYRSYRTGFVHWLQTKGKRSKKDAQKAFGQFLTNLAQAEGDIEELEAALEEIYGKPLSADETSKDDLEGQFLAWLSKL